MSSPGPGKGSTFWFTLPLAAHEEPAAAPEPAADEEEAEAFELVEEE